MGYVRCYVLQNDDIAMTCIDYINTCCWWPVVGKCNGTLRPDYQNTERWCSEPYILITGERAIPVIDEGFYNYVCASDEIKLNITNLFGQDIRLITKDLIVKEEEQL